MEQPDYVCALIRDEAGRLLLQLRPATARHAANQLTCFGGAREAGEGAVPCLLRELREELTWDAPHPCVLSVDLFSGPRWIAAFYPLHVPATQTLTTEQGFHLLRVPLMALPGLPLSPWHALVIAGWQQGKRRIEIPHGG
jgi:8-oxo-dGTP pyrophosphatase MutT (NUDIX family)